MPILTLFSFHSFPLSLYANDLKYRQLMFEHTFLLDASYSGGYEIMLHPLTVILHC